MIPRSVGDRETNSVMNDPNLPQDNQHPASLPLDKLLRACSITFGRRGGPGGQHRNKVETAVIIEHRPTGIRVEANERRSQGENRRVAEGRLRLALALRLRRAVSTESSGSELLDRYRTGHGPAISNTNPDYPPLVAEILDHLHVHDYSLAETGKALGISTGQFVRFLKKHAEVLAEVNRARQSRGLKRIR